MQRGCEMLSLELRNESIELHVGELVYLSLSRAHREARLCLAGSLTRHNQIRTAALDDGDCAHRTPATSATHAPTRVIVARGMMDLSWFAALLCSSCSWTTSDVACTPCRYAHALHAPNAVFARLSLQAPNAHNA